jgi:hypothetical protein
LEHGFYFFTYIGNVIIPTDEHIFQYFSEGLVNHQPVKILPANSVEYVVFYFYVIWFCHFVVSSGVDLETTWIQKLQFATRVIFVYTPRVHARGACFTTYLRLRFWGLGPT